MTNERAPQGLNTAPESKAADEYEPDVRAPGDAPAEFMRTFELLARKSGEVRHDTLPDLMNAALALAAIRHRGRIVAVAGAKRPNVGYRSKVFQKAAVPDPGKFPFELGWFYVEEEHRGRKLANMLVDVLVEKLGDARAYATSLEEYQAMHAALVRGGFARAGEPYPSTRPGKKLLVFVRPHAKQQPITGESQG